MRSKRSLERAKLSPFLESAFSQLLAELPRSRDSSALRKTRDISRGIGNGLQKWDTM
jgi:hypothetical protein